MIFDDNNNNNINNNSENNEQEYAGSQQASEKDLEQEKSEKDQELAQCKEELSSVKDQYVYLHAEFENYKKRYEKERVKWMSNAQASVLKDLLPIIDDFERALNNQQDVPEDVKSHLQGTEMILSSLKKMLSKYDVTPIENIATFDPEEHEAVMSVDSEEHESGSIVEILEKGYKFKDTVLRPAKVSVAA